MLKPVGQQDSPAIAAYFLLISLSYWSMPLIYSIFFNMRTQKKFQNIKFYQFAVFCDFYLSLLKKNYSIWPKVFRGVLQKRIFLQPGLCYSDSVFHLRYHIVLNVLLNVCGFDALKGRWHWGVASLIFDKRYCINSSTGRRMSSPLLAGPLFKQCGPSKLCSSSFLLLILLGDLTQHTAGEWYPTVTSLYSLLGVLLMSEHFCAFKNRQFFANWNSF